MKIKASLKREANKYINMPKIQKFCKENDLGYADLRPNGIKTIEEFADSSEENREKVNIWLDECVKEGIKHIYLSKIIFIENEEKYKSEFFWKQFIKKYDIKENLHINDCNSEEGIKYSGIHLEIENNVVKKVNLLLSLLVADASKSHTNPAIEGYPIFIELDISKNLIIIRLKSKSKMYRTKVIDEEKEIRAIDLDNKVSTEGIAYNLIKKLSRNIGFVTTDSKTFNDEIKNAYYAILNEIVETPKDIKDTITMFKELNQKYISDMIEKTEISCKYTESIEEDLNMLLEKFISISYPDKNIFKQSYAFPVKLTATDSEDTKVEETAANYQPLQTKAAFYDHKKIINAEKKCDGMTLNVYRRDTTYYKKIPFVVKFDFLYGKALSRIRFEEYVEEVDIQNVLSRITAVLS